MRHIVGLSGGKDSSAMALRLVELYPDRRFEFVCTPTGNELPAMFRHWAHLSELLGSRLVRVTGGNTLKSLAREHHAIPNWRMRFCTPHLKIKPFQTYLLAAAPATSYVGIRADETDREGVNHSQIDGITNSWPLVEWGWGLKQVIEYLALRGVTVPERTDCAWCFFQRLGEWWRLWKEHPDLYAEGEALEVELGHTFRSEDRDTWPASLAELRKEFESGRVPRGADQLLLPMGVAQRPRMCSICAR